MTVRSARACGRSPRSGAGSAIARVGLLLAREGVRLNHKKLRRLYTEERLQVRRRGGA